MPVYGVAEPIGIPSLSADDVCGVIINCGENRRAMQIHTLDLEFFRGETIAAYLVESAGHLALVETGPDSTWPHLVAALAKHGAKPEDVKDVLVTHIHLDHAGAAWRLARAGANVWVHPRGAPHMADPSKLLASAKRIYKDEMDSLWGTLEPIPADRLKVTADGARRSRSATPRLRVLETPGHAIHHNAYLLDGDVFTGDVGGVAIGDGPNLPPTPPPDIDLPTWTRSLERSRPRGRTRFYPTHFGRHPDVARRLDEMLDELQAWAGFVRARLDEGKDEPQIVPEFEAWLTDAALREGREPRRLRGLPDRPPLRDERDGARPVLEDRGRGGLTVALRPRAGSGQVVRSRGREERSASRARTSPDRAGPCSRRETPRRTSSDSPTEGEAASGSPARTRPPPGRRSGDAVNAAGLGLAQGEPGIGADHEVRLGELQEVVHPPADGARVGGPVVPAVNTANPQAGHGSSARGITRATEGPAPSGTRRCSGT